MSGTVNKHVMTTECTSSRFVIEVRELVTGDRPRCHGHVPPPIELLLQSTTIALLSLDDFNFRYHY